MTEADLATRTFMDADTKVDYAPAGLSGTAPARHHLMIGGTGRAGTSFLVQYLHLCGLDTMISREGLSSWEEHANAGLESFAADTQELPYVIKSAWFDEFVASFLANPGLELDVVVIPMRDLVEAASSRVLNEYAARYNDASTPAECTRWERWGATPGGVVYSLNPMDQARILSLSFHSALLALVMRDVPLVFLDFPRFIEDPDYLFSKLQPYLPNSCSAEQAALAHGQLADAAKVRTARELDQANSHAAAQQSRATSIQYPSMQNLNQAALQRSQRSTAAPASFARRLARRLQRMVG
jgi:hypothetical protein